MGNERKTAFESKAKELTVSRGTLTNLTITPNQAKTYGLVLNQDGVRRTAHDLLRYDHISFENLVSIWPELTNISPSIIEQLEIEAMYSGYLGKQEEDIEAFKREEGMAIPENFDYEPLPSISRELKNKLKATRPATLGAASRIQGMTPAAVVSLMAHIRKFVRSPKSDKACA